MNALLWVLAILLTVTVVGKLVMLGTGNMPPRTPTQEAWDVAINGALLAWVVFLLVRG